MPGKVKDTVFMTRTNMVAFEIHFFFFPTVFCFLIFRLLLFLGLGIFWYLLIQLKIYS